MKEKILLQLKTACGNTTSISEKTLQIIADRIAATVTEESQIEAAIELEKPILQAIDGNINFVAADAVKKVKPADKIIIPEKTKLDPIPDEPDWFKTYREKQDQETLVLKNKLENYDKEKATAQMTSKITAKLKEKGIPESYYKGRNLSIEDESGIDQLIASIDTDFIGFKQELAEAGVIISVPKSSSSGLKEGELLGEQIADKRNAGTSEGVQGKKLV
ncbi:MAG: hypothetical protein JJE17_08810 [Peptostreptococcaceae bacterium]|nr:hypothetical protein [Peptostreptococcaceae bacterium]